MMKAMNLLLMSLWASRSGREMISRKVGKLVDNIASADGG